MKTFFSEYMSNYQTYTFWYTQYAIIHSHDELDQAYSQWFLPYSNNLTLSEDIFYRCRSLRVDLSRFSFNSENRRVARKASEYHITRTLHKKSDFDTTHPDFEQFCLTYAHNRYGTEHMPIERFHYIMSREYANYILEYQINDQILWYVYLVVGKTFAHYWFSYFDVQFMQQFPVGTYLMADTIVRAKDHWLSYMYLGTCYQESGLYKVRNFDALQRWDGNSWSDDTKTLKQLCHTDAEVKIQDQFKETFHIPIYLQ